MVLVPMLQRAIRRLLVARGVRSRWVETPQGRLHLFDAEGAGTLPPVVCLHGLGSASTAFAGVLLRLRPDVQRVIAPDMPGHGFNPPPGLSLCVDSIFEAWRQLFMLELDQPAVIVGNSLGGAMAFRFALEHPERVLGVVLSSPAGAQLEPEEFRTLVSSFQPGNATEARALMARLYHRTPWFGPLLAPEVVQHFRAPHFRDLVQSFQPEQQFKPEELERLQVPVLVLWGRSDRLMPRSALEFYRRHLPPHAQIEELEALGHSPHIERPAVIAQRVIEFARSLAGGLLPSAQTATL